MDSICKKSRCAYAQRLLLSFDILFCVLDGTALADDIDLDLAGVIQRILDLLCDGAGQQDDLIVADDVGLDHDAHFAASLHGECLLDASKLEEISSRFSRRLT